MKRQDGDKVLVAGLGKSGLGALTLLLEQGLLPQAYDGAREADLPRETLAFLVEHGIPCYLGREPEIWDYDYLVASPGLPLDRGILAKARSLHLEIIGELELAYRFANQDFLAVTGTNGKTTTTAWLGHLYELAGRPYRLAGNIGFPVSQQVLLAPPGSTLVTEVSSFQLETIRTFKPRVSVLLNLSPDHLDRHGSLAAYKAAKYRLFENQDAGDVCVYKALEPHFSDLPGRCKARLLPFSSQGPLAAGAYAWQGQLYFRDGEGEERLLCRQEEVSLPGAHNLDNALATAAAAAAAGLPLDSIREGLRTFPGVEHRLEPVGTKRGIAYINDSKGTNPDATLRALDAVSPPVLLIGGGYEKEADFSSLSAALTGRVKGLFLMGATAPRMEESALAAGYPASRIQRCADLEDCLSKALDLAVSGDAILLSPACASWGQYANFEERGRHFKQLVEKLPD